MCQNNPPNALHWSLPKQAWGLWTFLSSHNAFRSGLTLHPHKLLLAPISDRDESMRSHTNNRTCSAHDSALSSFWGKQLKIAQCYFLSMYHRSGHHFPQWYHNDAELGTNNKSRCKWEILISRIRTEANPGQSHRVISGKGPERIKRKNRHINENINVY